MANEGKRPHPHSRTGSGNDTLNEAKTTPELLAKDHENELSPSPPSTPAKRQKRTHVPSRLHFEAKQGTQSPSSHGSPRTIGEFSADRQPPAPLPSTEVSCKLHVYFDRRPLEPPIDIFLDWMSWRDSFSKVENRALEQLVSQPDILDAHVLYRKSGICKVIRHSKKVLRKTEGDKESFAVPFHHMVDCCPAFTENEWTQLFFEILKFRGKYHHDDFHLHVEWNYSGFKSLDFDAPNFEKVVQKTLKAKMQKNWEDKPYISKIDLEHIMAADVVRHLISRDQTLIHLKLPGSEADGIFDMDKFAQDVFQWCSRMLAVCVYVGLPLICLWRIFRSGNKDENLPLPSAMETICSDHDKEFADFLMWQGSFVAQLFQDPKLIADDGGEGLEIDRRVVLPIQFNGNDDYKGEGAYGKVYKVTIDPDHHWYIPGKHNQLALKMFFDYGSQTSEDFKRECHMLKEISKMPSHDHVSTHISSFKHNDKFYMIFPLAECNLKTYLDNQDQPLCDKDFVTWITNQMKGLASAVCYLHRAGTDIVQDPLEHKLPPIRSRERTCFHHDLKPQNILVFEDESTCQIVLKISDFGSGRIGKPRTGMKGSSYATRDPNTGTPDYEAPDYLLNEQSSRPYDVWSLGCMFLEMLLWAFGLRSRIEFEELRLQHRDDELGVGTTAKFWYADAKKQPRLKPAVTASLEILKTHCRGYGVFEPASHTIENMFRIKPLQRPLARAVEDDFQAICTQSQRHFETNEGFYLKRGQVSAEIAAPVSAIASQPSTSRSPSVERRRQHRDSELLSPQTAEFQRPRGSRSRAESLPNQEILQQIGSQRDSMMWHPDLSMNEQEPTPRITPPAPGLHRLPQVLISDSGLATGNETFGSVLQSLNNQQTSNQEEVRPPGQLREEQGDEPISNGHL